MKNKILLLFVLCLTANIAFCGFFGSAARRTMTTYRATGDHVVRKAYKCPRIWPRVVASGALGMVLGFEVCCTFDEAIRKEGYLEGFEDGMKAMKHKTEVTRRLKEAIHIAEQKDKNRTVSV